MQEKNSIGLWIFKISASAIVIAAGIAFLFPEMIIPFIHSKTVPVARVVSIPQSSSQIVRRIDDVGDTTERKLNVDGREISYRTEFFAGNINGALSQIDADMRRNGYKALMSQPDDRFGMILYNKGEEIIGTSFVPYSAGIKIIHCSMSFSQKTIRPGIPADMKDILLGKTMVCFDSGNRNPVIVTNATAGIRHIEKQLKEKLVRHGWELIPQTNVSGNSSAAVILQAKRGTMLCSVAIAGGSLETNGMNSITYKITHL